MFIRKLLAVVTAFVLIAPLAAAGEIKVKLHVKPPLDLKWGKQTICGGIPLPRGKFKAGTAFNLSVGGEVLPAQIIPLVVDGAGFLRWVLVDTQFDISGDQEIQLLLSTGPVTAPKVPLTVVNGDDGVKVDTGRIKFSISKKTAFSLFSRVEARGKELFAGGSSDYTDVTVPDKPATFVALAPETIKVTDSGPMRATIKVSGRFQGDDLTAMRYIARITCWAGQSRVAVKFSLVNSNSDHYCFRYISGAKISMKLPAAATAVQVGKTILLKSGAARISAHDLYLQANPPRKVGLLEGQLVLESIAGQDGPWSSRSMILFDCTHYSSHYVFDFAAGDDAQLATREKTDRNPLHLMAESKWYFETEALAVGKFGTQADELKCYDTWKWKYNSKRIPKSPGNHFRRFRYYVRGEDNHYETEEDVLESFTLMYLRTGSYAFFKQGRAWAHYNMDLQSFRTDGWQHKDGAVWWAWKGSPMGNAPQRKTDPVTGLRNRMLRGGREYKAGKHSAKRVPVNLAIDLSAQDSKEIQYLANCKQCYCHCYASGLAAWFCITGDRDALEAAIDSVEQNYDSQKRGKKKTPGKSSIFSRDFTRSSYLAPAVLMADPTNKFLGQAADFLAEVYLKRPRPELRGLVLPSGKIDAGTIKKLTAGKGSERMQELGVKLEGGLLVDAKGNKWEPLINPHTWMFSYQSGALEAYWRETGNEDARDHCVANGQALAHVLFQKKHFNLSYGSFLVDFPQRGFAWDLASWQIPDGVKLGEGTKINGYLAGFYPDVCARAYSLCGENFLKQRAYDYWWGSSHRGYNSKKMHALGSVGTWVNISGVHAESCTMTGRTFYEWSHPRSDPNPPEAIKDLTVSIKAGKAEVSFTAPADQGGRVLRYQLKCSDRRILDYGEFLKAYNNHSEKTACNWFLAVNLKGEPAPKAPGSSEKFTVSGLPAGARYFAIRTFDQSSNRSAISNLVEVAAGK
jgi:PcRGLX-like protein central beta sandwich domain